MSYPLSESPREICFCCCFANPVGGVEEHCYRSKHKAAEKRKLCVLCRNTQASVAQDYIREDWSVLSTINYGLNEIRRDLLELKNPSNKN